MRTTGKFDTNQREIFEGDKVVYCWGFFSWKGKIRKRFQIHTITVREPYLMANGEMRTDGDGIIFTLGNAYNSWNGSDVYKLNEEELKELAMPDDINFFLDDDGKAIKFTDQHLSGLSDEEWQKELERRKGYFIGSKPLGEKEQEVLNETYKKSLRKTPTSGQQKETPAQ